MLSWRLTSEAQPRSKNGQPPQRTTGVARANWIQTSARPPSRDARSRARDHLAPSRAGAAGSSGPGRSRTGGSCRRARDRPRRRPRRSSAPGPCRRSGTPRADRGRSPGASGRCSGCPAPAARRCRHRERGIQDDEAVVAGGVEPAPVSGRIGLEPLQAMPAAEVDRCGRRARSSPRRSRGRRPSRRPGPSRRLVPRHRRADREDSGDGFGTCA